MNGHDSLDDAELLARAPDEIGALEALYRRYVRRIAAFAARRCPTAEDVADVVAGTFDRLLRYADRYDPARGPVPAFVFAIAGSEIADLRRREARDRALVSRLSGRDLLDSDDVARIEAAIDAVTSLEELAPALDALSPAEGEVLRLLAAGLSPTEAAARLGITPNAARVRLARARQRLRRRTATPGSTSPAGAPPGTEARPPPDGPPTSTATSHPTLTSASTSTSGPRPGVGAEVLP